jgi:hypothetical protein
MDVLGLAKFLLFPIAKIMKSLLNQIMLKMGVLNLADFLFFLCRKKYDKFIISNQAIIRCFRLGEIFAHAALRKNYDKSIRANQV